MNASIDARRPRLAQQSGVLRIEIAAVVMLFMALAIVLITNAPAHDANPPTAVAAPPMTIAGHGVATAPLQRVAAPQSETAGASAP